MDIYWYKDISIYVHLYMDKFGIGLAICSTVNNTQISVNVNYKII